jgi:AraC-like DNA-binding protein
MKETRLTYQGKSIAEWASIKKMDPSSMSKRLRRMPWEEAVLDGGRAKHPFEGEMLSLAEIARRLGVNIKTLKRRIEDYGYDIAIRMPSHRISTARATQIKVEPNKRALTIVGEVGIKRKAILCHYINYKPASAIHCRKCSDPMCGVKLAAIRPRERVNECLTR